MWPRDMQVEGWPAPAAAVISSESLSRSIAWAWMAASYDMLVDLCVSGELGAGQGWPAGDLEGTE